MSLVIQNLGTFTLYAVIAVFVQNTVFTRGFGVSRLTRLVSDSAVDSLTFCGLLCLVNVISAPAGYYARTFLQQPQFWFRDYIAPLVFVVCALAAFLLVMVVIAALRPPNKRDFVAVLPMATLNSAVLGPMLITASQNYDFFQTVGFALGSGLGYTFAVLVVAEGERKTQSERVPTTFRGLPIKLIYIGILSLAFYGLTGHMVAIG